MQLLSTKQSLLIYSVLSLPSIVLQPGIETYVDVLIRVIPLIFLSLVSAIKLRELSRVLITLALCFFISGAFFRVLVDEGKLLAWAGSTFMALSCYGICFWRQAQVTPIALLKTTPLMLLLALSSYWAVPAYDVLKPAMWLLIATATFMSIGAALHRPPATWIYCGGLMLYSALALFAMKNRGSPGSVSLYPVFISYYFSHAAIVFGLIHFQTTKDNQYNHAAQQ